MSDSWWPHLVWISELDGDEMETLINARHLRYVSGNGGVRVVRSISDTSAAARRRKTHYDRMD